MATVNFSVPQDVKDAFDRAFKGKNKSAILSDLMRKAVEEVDLRALRMRAFEEINAGRSQRPTLTTRQLRKARVAGRP
jgi:ABC-type Mn2+/Zn2+ transport system ATPase subunit